MITGECKADVKSWRKQDMFCGKSEEKKLGSAKHVEPAFSNSANSKDSEVLPMQKYGIKNVYIAEMFKNNKSKTIFHDN